MMRRLAAEAVSLFCWFYVFFLLCEIKFCIFALKNPLFQPDLSNFQVLTQYNTNNMQTKSLQLRKLWGAALFILWLCLAGMTKMYAYDFSAVCETGQTLYYNIIDAENHYVELTCPGTATSSGCWSGFNRPTGNIVLSESVQYDEITYLVTSIGNYTFYRCSGFTGDLTIPNSVTSIGHYAFYNCGGFTGSLTIPASVTSIGNRAFYYCSNFTEVYYNATNCTDISYSSDSNSPFMNCGGSLVIGNNVERIPANMFYKGGFTGSLTIGNSVTEIGVNAFINCSFTGSLTIPNSMTMIGYAAFSGCNGFTGNLTLGSSLPTIGNYAFYGCSGFTSMTSLAATPPTLYEYSFHNVNHSIPVTVPCGSIGAYQNEIYWSQFTNIVQQNCPSYEISTIPSPEEGGTVTGSGIFEIGEICTLTATPNQGYSFCFWTENDTIVFYGSTYTFVVHNDRNLVANFGDCSDVVIGYGGTATNLYLPSYSYYNYSFTQQIYTVDEIGKSGEIISVAFYNSGTTKTRDYDIYLVNTDKYFFESTTDWIPLNSDDLIFSGSVTMESNSWTTINFETPYTYNLSSNLALIVDDNSGSWTQSPHMACRVFDANGYQAICIYSDGTNYDPYSPLQYTGTRFMQKNQIILGFLSQNLRFVTTSLNPVGAGTIDGGGIYQIGDTCTLSATANSVYQFVSWIKDGIVVSDNPIISFAVTENANYVANFNSLINPDANNIVYVKPDGCGLNDGSSWENATSNLNLAMEYSGMQANKPTIWVAAGTYYGDGVAYHNAFTMVDGVNVYGGFAGNEPADYDLDLRDFEANETVLDGQNEQRVLYQPADFENNTTWSGFSIKNGYLYVENTSIMSYGAGAFIRNNTILENSIITANSLYVMDNVAQGKGAGVYLKGVNSQLKNCVVTDNNLVKIDGGGPLIHGSYGGGVYAELASVNKCVIANNHTNSWAGGILVTAANVNNSLIVNNNAEYSGGIHAFGDATTIASIINCDIINNNAIEKGGGVGTAPSTPIEFINCIIWGNNTDTYSYLNLDVGTATSFNYCAIEDGYSGSANIDLASDNDGTEALNYVRFIDVENNDFQLQYNSACVDAGDPNYSTSDTLDLAGNPRIYNGRIDIGCYEFNSTPIETNISAEICQGEDYLQNGFEIYYPEVGENQYSITLSSSQNIDSIVNLTLTVYPIYFFSEDTTLCNASSYSWRGYTLTESGTYYDSLQTIHGCDSIYALSLEFINTPLGEFTYMSPTNNYPFTSLPITFSWDAVSGAEYYDLYVWDEDDPMPNEPFASNLTGRNYSTTALFNYHTYNWFVMARNACYETSSSVKSFYLVIEPSLNVNVEHIDFGEVTFNQSVSTTLSVSGVVLEDSLNVQISGNDAAMFSITEASGWNDYTGGILIVTFYPTVPQYSYNANIVINSGTISTTTSLTGGLADMFVFNTYVAEDVYAMNSSIPIYGSLTDLNDNPVANEEIEIGVFVMGMKRTLQAFTDGSGQFSAVFEPMPSESGYYTVNSGRVGNHSTAVHDDFNIPGMTLVSSDYILCTVTQDQPRTDSILIRNKSNLSLSNIQVSPISVPDGASFSFMPLSLGGLEENWLVYTVNGSTLTQGNYYEEARLKATSSEGAEMSLSIWYYCMEPRGVLDVMPKSLATTMTKGKSKIVDVMLTNNGTAATGNIYIDLPDVEWMSVVGNGTLSSIAVNDTAYFSIRFSPAEDIQLGQYSGTIVINSERGDAVGLPYMITAVSDSTGMFVIDVTDDYTWNTNNGHGPHLEGAEVTLKGYYSFETVAQGYTDANGIFQIDNLPEGYYRLHVVADRHSQYDNNILITAGETNHQDIYLQYQAITYSWTVEPTEIVDEYTYELNVVFETNVPVPVVVIEAPKKLPEFDESYTFNYVITNHGLIDANDVELHVPISDDYLFTPLFDHIDTLQALTTIVIPCIVVHNDYREDFLRNDCAEWGFTWTEYTYKCHKIDGTIEVNSSSGFVYTLLGSKPCNPPEGGNGNGGNGFNAPLLGIVGGHGGGFGNPFFTSPLLEMWYECDNGCTNMVLWGIDKLLSKAPLISYVYNTAKTILDIATFMENDAEDNLITMYDLYSDISESLGESVPFNPAMAYLSISKEVETVKQNIIHCYKYLNGTATRNYELELDYLEVPNEIGAMLQYMDEYVSAATKIVDIMDMYFCDTTWFDSENNELDGFMNMVFEYNSMYGRVYVDQALLSYKPSNISDDQAISFVERFNNTVDIYNGIVINNDNFIPIDSINSKLLSIINIENEAILLGFESGVDRITHLIDEAYEYLEENKSSSVCAKVKVQFSQKMTMTREAFDGTFTVHNGHDTEPMEAIGLDFVIKDEDGNVCNNLFQINILSLSNSLTGIDGSGSLGAGLDGVAKIQFIPTKYAALTEPKVYYFGGTFSFIDPYTLDEIVYDLYPVELTVHPSPDLYVDYFMQRDILGDDALTEDVVEPSVPAELGVIINNKGAGIAKNVLLETAEPKIIDNEKGLAIDFTMYGASFNGSPRQLGLMEIPFGNIEAGHTAVGEWQFTSTLLGHFISYEAHVIHNSSYGNPDLSLVSHLAIHELIHPIYAYGDLDDGINDFLVNDIPMPTTRPIRFISRMVERPQSVLWTISVMIIWFHRRTPL